MSKSNAMIYHTITEAYSHRPIPWPQYWSMSVCFLLILVLMSKGRLVLIHIFKYHMAWLIAIAVAFTYFKKEIIVNS